MKRWYFHIIGPVKNTTYFSQPKLLFPIIKNSCSHDNNNNECQKNNVFLQTFLLISELSTRPLLRCSMNEFSSGATVKTWVQQHAFYQQGIPERRMNVTQLLHLVHFLYTECNKSSCIQKDISSEQVQDACSFIKAQANKKPF
jgi:hypothetical protein